MMADASTLRKCRGVVQASITCLSGRVKELESKADQPTTIDVARCTKDKQESLDSEFKVHHFAVIDVIDEKDGATLRKEQDILEKQYLLLLYVCRILKN